MVSAWSMSLDNSARSFRALLALSDMFITALIIRRRMKRKQPKRTFDLSKHDLGKISTKVMQREAGIAQLNLAKAESERKAGNYSNALDLYFRCAGIGVNVICTAKIHKTRISKKVLNEMREAVDTATDGIRVSLREGSGLDGASEDGLQKARTQLKSAERARSKGDLRLAVSRALTAAVTAARASRGAVANNIIQHARVIIQDAAIQRLLRRRA